MTEYPTNLIILLNDYYFFFFCRVLKRTISEEVHTLQRQK